MSTEWSEQGSEQERIREDVNHFGAKLTNFVYRPTNNDASDIESENRRLQIALRMTEFLHQTGSPSSWIVRFRVPEESEHPTTTTIQITDLPPTGSESFDRVVVDTFTYTADDDEGIVVGPDGITDQTSLSYIRLIREGLLEVVDEVIANPSPSTENDLDPVITGFSALRMAGTRLSGMRRIVDDVQGNLSQYRQIRERRDRQRERDKSLETTFATLEDRTGAPLPVTVGENKGQEAEQLLDVRSTIASRIALRSVLAGTPVPEDTRKHLDEKYIELLEEVEKRLSSPDQERSSATLRGIIDAIITGDDLAHGDIDEWDDQTQQTLRTLRERVEVSREVDTVRQQLQEAQQNIGETERFEAAMQAIIENGFARAEQLLSLSPAHSKIAYALMNEGFSRETRAQISAENVQAALRATLRGEVIPPEVEKGLTQVDRVLIRSVGWGLHPEQREREQAFISAVQLALEGSPVPDEMISPFSSEEQAALRDIQTTVSGLRERVTSAEQSGTYRPPFLTDLEIELKAEAEELRSVLRIIAEGNIPNLYKLTPQDREIIAKLGLKDKSVGGEVTPESISYHSPAETRDILDNDFGIRRVREILTPELDDKSKRDLFSDLEMRAGVLTITNRSLSPTAVFAYLDNLRREMGVVLIPRTASIVNNGTATALFGAALRSAQGEDQEGQERALNLLNLLHNAPLK